MRMRNILFLILVISVLHNSINSSDTNPSDEGPEPKKKRVHSKWTLKMQNTLIRICRDIPSDEPYYYKKFRKRWRELYPNYNVSDRTLFRKLSETPDKITGRGERLKRKFNWDDEATNELIDVYFNTHPYNASHPVGLLEEWESRHPDFPKFNEGYLLVRARKYLERHPSYVKGESSKRLFEWTNKHDLDIYHIYHVTLPEGKSQPIHMHRIWTDLHPGLRELTHQQKADRVDYLRKHPPNENFPWTSEQNQELLRIYLNTNPGLANQGQRIYEIWSKIHPRYSFMTPYYLQVHASTLAHHEETKDDVRKKKIKLTNEQKAFIANMYRQLAGPYKLLYNFHKAWVQEYPSLAHITPLNLIHRAKRLNSRDKSYSAEMIRGDGQFRNPQHQHRRYGKYTREEKADLQATFQQTNPQELGHVNRFHEEWIQKHEKGVDIKKTSLKTLVRRWNQKRSDEKGKAPMVIPKDEVRSGYSPDASDMSQ